MTQRVGLVGHDGLVLLDGHDLGGHGSRGLELFLNDTGNLGEKAAIAGGNPVVAIVAVIIVVVAALSLLFFSPRRVGHDMEGSRSCRCGSNRRKCKGLGLVGDCCQ